MSERDDSEFIKLISQAMEARIKAERSKQSVLISLLLRIAIAYREECRPAEDVLAENALNGNNEIAAWWRQVDRVIARAEGAIE